MTGGRFDRWLVETQIEPTFRAHPFLLWAKAYVVPRVWSVEDPSQPTWLMIFYCLRETLQLSGAVRALANDEQDPNLPDGVSNYDL